MPDTTTIPVLKSNIQVSILLGSEYINKLQAVLLFLSSGKDSVYVDTLKNKLTTIAELTPEEQSIVTMTVIMQNITQLAQDGGFIEYKSITDLVEP